MDHRMAVGTHGAQIFYGIDPVFFTNLRQRHQVVNMDQPLGCLSITLTEV